MFLYWNYLCISKDDTTNSMIARNISVEIIFDGTGGITYFNNSDAYYMIIAQFDATIVVSNNNGMLWMQWW